MGQLPGPIAYKTAIIQKIRVSMAPGHATSSGGVTENNAADCEINRNHKKESR